MSTTSITALEDALHDARALTRHLPIDCSRATRAIAAANEQAARDALAEARAARGITLEGNATHYEYGVLITTRSGHQYIAITGTDEQHMKAYGAHRADAQLVRRTVSAWSPVDPAAE